jgi:hypothetical protein
MNNQLVSWLQMVWEALSQSDPLLRNAMLEEARSHLDRSSLLGPIQTPTGHCGPA